MGKRLRSVMGGLCAAVTVGMITLALVGCGGGATTDKADESAEQKVVASEEAATQADDVTVRVASLKGPTSIGIVGLMESAEAGELADSYNFTIAGTADEVLPAVIAGDVDIALVPANAAATLYNKTASAVSVIDINTLGVLYVVTADASVTDIADLAGRTVYLTGKGTTPEYVTTYLLESAGIADTVTLEYRSEATELAALLEADPTATVILPEPYATSVIAKNAELTRAVSLTDAWDELQGADGSTLVTGVTIVRNEFLTEHPDTVADFVVAQAASVDFANGDPESAAKLVVDAGIVANEQVAAAAIPYCNLVCVTGDEMRDMLAGYLEVLYERDAASVGGALPGDDFYASV